MQRTAVQYVTVQLKQFFGLIKHKRNTIGLVGKLGASLLDAGQTLVNLAIFLLLPGIAVQIRSIRQERAQKKPTSC